MKDHIKEDHQTYFHLDVSIPMAYQVLTSDQAAVPLPSVLTPEYLHQHFFMPKQALPRHDEQGNDVPLDASLLACLPDQQDLLLIVQALEEKIHLLASLSMTYATLRRMIRRNTFVHLSAADMTIAMDEQTVVSGDWVDLLLFIRADQEPLVIRSQVQSVSEAGQVLLDYHDMDEQDRRHLVNFVHAKELEELNRLKAAKRNELLKQPSAMKGQYTPRRESSWLMRAVLPRSMTDVGLAKSNALVH
jgi:hypothetical protein